MTAARLINREQKSLTGLHYDGMQAFQEKKVKCDPPSFFFSVSQLS
jgi:hypothetical protein